MGLEDVHSFDGVFGFVAVVCRLDGLHGVDCHI